ncbi:NUDIX domain-containing protein [Candidatus Woesebacteria bacterium]|nr:NUDIX domain-containing protein [Candidatus Woesebacteria bacterium]
MKHTFINANLEPVPYDGSEVTWRVSAYALIIKDGKLLVAKSRHEKFYDVIGGGVDIGETIEEALHREALEEAGAHIEIGKLLFTAMDWFYHRKGKFYQTLQLYYQAELVSELEQATDPDIEWTGFVPITEVGHTYTLAVSESAKRSIRQFLTSSAPA